jgi:hypothetical protein
MGSWTVPFCQDESKESDGLMTQFLIALMIEAARTSEASVDN